MSWVVTGLIAWALVNMIGGPLVGMWLRHRGRDYPEDDEG